MKYLPNLTFKEFNEKYNDNKLIRWGDRWTVPVIILVPVLIVLLGYLINQL